MAKQLEAQLSNDLLQVALVEERPRLSEAQQQDRVALAPVLHQQALVLTSPRLDLERRAVQRQEVLARSQRVPADLVRARKRSKRNNKQVEAHQIGDQRP